MIYETVRLTPFEEATLTALCISNTPDLKQTPRRAVVVCPGGGYSKTSDREAEPVVAQFLAAGFATFLLRYTCKEGAQNFAPLKQVALAIKHVRDNAARYNVDPDYVFTCGFSAGGHVAASAGILWDRPEVRELMGDTPDGYWRPTGMILSYPVITGGEKAHKGSFYNLIGTTEPTDAQLDVYSLEKHVKPTTPPAFLWHTSTDSSVPIYNSLYLATALADARVPFELHVFPEGRHGLSLANEQTARTDPDLVVPHVQCWIDLAIRWAKEFQI